MQAISQSSAHSIRALTYLAQQDEHGFQLVRAMADELELPAPYLAKILQPLVNRGLLESQRGRGGGFRLARRPDELTLHQIVDAQEQLGGARLCLLGQSECSDERACPMHQFWKRACADFQARLSSTRLSDLVGFCQRRPDSGYPGRGAGTKAARRRRGGRGRGAR